MCTFGYGRVHVEGEMTRVVRTHHVYVTCEDLAVLKQYGAHVLVSDPHPWSGSDTTPHPGCNPPLGTPSLYSSASGRSHFLDHPLTGPAPPLPCVQVWKCMHPHPATPPLTPSSQDPPLPKTPLFWSPLPWTLPSLLLRTSPPGPIPPLDPPLPRTLTAPWTSRCTPLPWIPAPRA